jgi:hypothetical protein
MRPGVAVLIVLMGLVPAAASAQDGLRSASLPERPLTASVPPPPSRSGGYRPGPRTYRPDTRRRSPLPVFGYYEPQLGYPYDEPYGQPIIVVQVPGEVTRPGQAEPPAPVPAVPATPYVAGTPGRPKTFYLIPGCYAGDRRPDPESLAPGCSITRLRVVPPS